MIRSRYWICWRMDTHTTFLVHPKRKQNLVNIFWVATDSSTENFRKQWNISCLRVDIYEMKSQAQLLILSTFSAWYWPFFYRTLEPETETDDKCKCCPEKQFWLQLETLHVFIEFLTKVGYRKILILFEYLLSRVTELFSLFLWCFNEDFS